MGVDDLHIFAVLDFNIILFISKVENNDWNASLEQHNVFFFREFDSGNFIIKKFVLASEFEHLFEMRFQVWEVPSGENTFVAEQYRKD